MQLRPDFPISGARKNAGGQLVAMSIEGLPLPKQTTFYDRTGIRGL